jgi:hypothetical protein
MRAAPVESTVGEIGRDGSKRDRNRHDLKRPANAEAAHDPAGQEKLEDKGCDVQPEAIEITEERR